MLATSLRALLDQAIDYAGMIPPCDLALEPALRNQASYLRSTEAWMLNGFVLPIKRFDAATQFLSEFNPHLTLSSAELEPKNTSVNAFLDALKYPNRAIASFSKYDTNLVSVSHLEVFLPDDVDSASLKKSRAIVGELPFFCEAPHERSE